MLKFELGEGGKVISVKGMATVKRIKEVGLVQASLESKFELLDWK